MVASIFTLTLDLQKPSQHTVGDDPLYVHEMDYGMRWIAVTFKDGNAPYSLSEDASVVFRARHKDGGEVIEKATSIGDNMAYLIIPDSIIDKPGVTLCEFVISGVQTGSSHPRSVELHSPEFHIVVRPASI